jgi:hypothetical protein
MKRPARAMDITMLRKRNTQKKENTMTTKY